MVLIDLAGSTFDNRHAETNSSAVMEVADADMPSSAPGQRRWQEDGEVEEHQQQQQGEEAAGGRDTPGGEEGHHDEDLVRNHTTCVCA